MQVHVYVSAGPSSTCRKNCLGRIELITFCHYCNRHRQVTSEHLLSSSKLNLQGLWSSSQLISVMERLRHRDIDLIFKVLGRVTNVWDTSKNYPPIKARKHEINEENCGGVFLFRIPILHYHVWFSRKDPRNQISMLHVRAYFHIA